MGAVFVLSLTALEMVNSFLASIALVAIVRGAVIDKEKELDAAQDLIINLNKVSTLDRKLAYRCGMFFPDPKDPRLCPCLLFSFSMLAGRQKSAPPLDLTMTNITTSAATFLENSPIRCP